MATPGLALAYSSFSGAAGDAAPLFFLHHRVEREEIGVGFAHAVRLAGQDAGQPQMTAGLQGSTLISGASSRSGPARMLATTTSAFRSSGWSSGRYSSRRSETPLRSALSRLA